MTATKEQLQALLERVEKAEWPDRELDAAIDVTLFGGETIWVLANYTMDSHPASKRPSKHHVGGFAKEHVPLVTASIDAALALVDRALPGWWLHGLGRSPLHGLWWCQLYSIEAQQAAESEERDTSPLAILAALLKALISQSEEKGE